jgi:hypothetical protein
MVPLPSQAELKIMFNYHARTGVRVISTRSGTLMMPTLLHLKDYMGPLLGHGNVEVIVTLHETFSRFRGKETMRVNFTTELKVDVDTTDDALRKVLIDFVLAKAREVYGSAAMLAKTPPVMSVSITSREGKQVLPVFGAPVRDTDEDDVD